MPYDFKVDSDQLLAKSGELKTEKNTIMNQMEDIKSKISSLTGIHKGDAADAYQAKFRQAYANIENTLNIVQQYTTDLDSASASYVQGEREAVSTADGLSTPSLK